MWKPIVGYTVTFVSLFVAHILAAASDYELVFKIIAGLITIQTLFAGFILHLMGGDVRHARIPGASLGAGLGWAYSGMQFSWSIVFWVIVVIIIQYGTEKGLKYNRVSVDIDG